MRRRSRWARVAITGLLALVLAWGVSLGAVLVWERLDQSKPSDAIVVLGAAQYAGHPSPVLRARLDHAIALWNRHLAPVLIVTGGRGSGDTTSEAEVSRRYAIQHGVPAGAIKLESTGRTTSESIAGVVALLADQPHPTVLLVSDPFHMFRLTIIARRHGLTALASPTPTSPIAASKAERWKYAFGESFKAPFAFVFERSGD